jgi:octopine/nopaline transport system substrate-binding protein
MRLKSFLLGAVALAALSGAALAQTKTLTIATEGAYAPWNFTEPSGKLAGFEIDLAADLCARMKVECKIIAQDWDGIIPGVNAGKFDVIMAGMSITEKRKQSIAFSVPYAMTPNGFTTLTTTPLAKLPGTGTVLSFDKDGPAAEKALEDMKALLKGKVIGVQTSTTNANVMEKYFKGVVELREYKTAEQHDLDLLAGRVDAVFASRVAETANLKKPEFKDLALVGPGFLGGLLGEGVGVGLRKADTELKAKLDEAIKGAVADGVVKKLSEKWMGVDITPR